MSDDFIQDAVNAETDAAIKRYQKHIEYKIMMTNKKRREHKKQRKLERINRRKGRK